VGRAIYQADVSVGIEDDFRADNPILLKNLHMAEHRAGPRWCKLCTFM